MGRKRFTPDPLQDPPIFEQSVDLNHAASNDATASLLSPDPRTNCTIVVDNSGSMHASGAARSACLALPGFRDAVLKDSQLSRSLDWAVVTFSDSARVLSDFGPVADFTPPAKLEPGRGTAMGTAVIMTLGHLTKHIAKRAAQGISTRHSFVFLISDGHPTGEGPEKVEEAARMIDELERKKQLSFLCIAVGETASVQTLRRLAPRREILGLDHVDFGGFFAWLTRSLRSFSVSQPGAVVQFDDPIKRPDKPEGWGYFIT